jgi:pyroglutamyl-peptidase
MRLLITAFEPFGGGVVNQSHEILKTLDQPHLHKLLLPVNFASAFLQLQAYVNTHQITHIIALGEGPNQALHLEHLALNIQHARIPDNQGHQPQQQSIKPDAPIVMKTTFLVDKLATWLTNAGIPFHHSYHAGTYVCNDLYYRMLLELSSTPSIFIHVSNQPQLLPVQRAGIHLIVANLIAKKD